MNNEGLGDWLDEKWILILVLAVGIAATGYWGYGKYTTLNQIENELDNRYQQAFQGLNHQVDSLEEELGALVVSNTVDNVSVNLSNVWRSAYSARENLGELPLNSDALDNLKGLLSNISRYSKHLDRRVVNRELKENERQMLSKFRQKIQVANRGLEAVHNKMEQENFTWYDKRRISIREDKKEYSASPLAGLNKLDGKLKLTKIKDKLKSVVPGNIMSSNQQSIIAALSALEGEKVAGKKAIAIAKKFIKNPEQYNYTLAEDDKIKLDNGKMVEAKLPAYAIKAVHQEDEDKVIRLDISKHGGQVVWLLNQRGIGEHNVNIDQARQSAKQFLKDNGYENVVIESAEKFPNKNPRQLIVEFLPARTLDNGKVVLIKADRIKVEVALDNGEITGFNGIDYVLYHHTREVNELTPKLSKAEVKKKLNNNLKIEDSKLVLINDETQERLCYEFIGRVKGGEKKYSIKIDARTGREVSIKSLDSDIYTIAR
ncbi:hypothetical protein Halha_0449 [Halobacteroides halobius DSM 5150]|uniref:Germination protein YpeB n=1 Tax=Halobacteroides halobius (strain ATCC 35273 / DSM 5150 / MD-1) TaxID=748449 RepID=L0K602_HALHC|nr:PepSY1/2 domain-containing protein [Halobacteroides halobius]AGB40441.1 hypothetical protein Halha_0449 [Halobacteroides halobius DSM 5150]